MKPDDISAGAIGAAIKCYADLPVVYDGWDETAVIHEIARAIDEAVREEREACARVADEMALGETDNHGDLYDGDVAAAIRNRKQEG